MDDEIDDGEHPSNRETLTYGGRYELYESGTSRSVAAVQDGCRWVNESVRLDLLQVSDDLT